jgi:hypothetical protein
MYVEGHFNALVILTYDGSPEPTGNPPTRVINDRIPFGSRDIVNDHVMAKLIGVAAT